MPSQANLSLLYWPNIRRTKTHVLIKCSSFQLFKLINFKTILKWLKDVSAKLTIDPEVLFVIGHSESRCVQIT